MPRQVNRGNVRAHGWTGVRRACMKSTTNVNADERWRLSGDQKVALLEYSELVSRYARLLTLVSIRLCPCDKRA